MDIRTSSLEDPRYAAFAWGRYRSLMWWMAMASGAAAIAGNSDITAIAGLAVLRWLTGPMPWPMLIGTACGIFFSVLLAAALMGLVFLSSGTGHDESIRDPFADMNDAA